MILRINNAQRFQPLHLPSVRRLAALLFRHTARRSPGIRWSTVTLVLTDDPGIAAVKHATFGVREITDVVTLCYAPSPADPGTEGEVFVNVQRAFSRPCRQGWSPARELALYIAHGMDHLTGADDQTPDERRRMRERERRWIAAPDCLDAIGRLAPPTADRPAR